MTSSKESNWLTVGDSVKASTKGMFLKSSFLK